MSSSPDGYIFWWFICWWSDDVFGELQFWLCSFVVRFPSFGDARSSLCAIPISLRIRCCFVVVSFMWSIMLCISGMLSGIRSGGLIVIPMSSSSRWRKRLSVEQLGVSSVRLANYP